MFRCACLSAAASLFACLGLADGPAAKHAFQPNPALAGLADNTVMNLGPFTWEKPEGEPSSGSVTDYSGMTYDPHNHRILLFGGGHATTWTDAIYAFAFTNLQWSALYKPTPHRFYKQENMDRGFWKAGAEENYPRPVGRHTYDLLVVPDDREELYVLMNGCGPSAVAPGFGYWGGGAGRYDFRTGRWTILPTAPFGGYGGVAEYDPISKLIVGTSGQQVHTYNPTNGTSVRLLQDISDRFKVSGYSGTMVYFPPDQRMYVIPADKKVWSLDLNRTNFPASKIDVTQVTGSCPGSECAFAYDVKNQVIGGGVQNNIFYIYDPAKKAWIASEIQGGKPGTMTYHCLVYDPVDNVYVFIAGNQTWAYRWRK
jgi:hypothetical protein